MIDENEKPLPCPFCGYDIADLKRQRVMWWEVDEKLLKEGKRK